MKALQRVIHPVWIILLPGLAALVLSAPVAIASSATRTAKLSRKSQTDFAPLRAKPEFLHFKNVAVGGVARRQVTLQNSSQDSLLLSALYASEPNFRIHGIKLPLHIPAGGSVRFDVSFTPTRKRDFQSDIEIKANGAWRSLIHADGKGVTGWKAGLVSNPRNLDFGSIEVGARSSRRITLLNSSASRQTVQNLAASETEFGFSGLNFPFTLSSGESITFDVFFSPRRPAPVLGEMMVEADDYDFPIPLRGKGARSGQVGITPGSLNFGTVNVGANSTLTATLRAGATAVTIYSAGLTSSEFALNGLSFPQTIAPHQSKTYSVTFLPRSSGGVSAALSFQTSSAASRIQQALLGAGAPPPPSPASHRVTLSWNASGSGISGYYVYRGTTYGGPYARLNPVPDSNTSYQDSTVQGGHTYYYVTTAIASNGTQSSFSNQVEVAIP